MRFSPRCWAIPLAFLMSVGTLVGPLPAVNIVIQLDNEGDNPSYDPNGLKLKAIFEAAATLWEDYLPAAGTYEVDVAWDGSEFPDEGGLGVWFEDILGDNNIYLNPNVSWFIDPTPLDHSEFDFDVQDVSSNGNFRGGQWLYTDLSASQKDAWFNGSPHPLMEVGYRGKALASEATGKFDLLSTVIHELGHELGVNFEGGPWTVNSNFLPFGSAVALEDNGHLAARTSLMCEGCGLEGTRRLPSAIDIFSVADDEGFTSVDLPRKDYSGSGNWGTASKWLGGRVPDSGDHVFLRASANVDLAADGHVDRLHMSGVSTLTLQGTQMTVDKDLKVGFATIAGNGVVTFTDLDFDGFVKPSGGTLELRGSGDIRFTGDIDTTGGGNIDITGTGTAVADFTGNLSLRPSRRFRMLASPWTLGPTGRIVLHTSGLAGGIIGGEKVTVEGSVEVQGTGVTLIDAPVRFSSSADLFIPGNSALYLNQATEYSGGTYTGPGALVQDGDATVIGNTTIKTSYFDMDGGANPSTMTINQNRTLRVELVNLESGATSDGYDGTLNINGGQFDVAFLIPQSWRMEGTTNLNGKTGADAIIKGSGVVFGDASGVRGAEAVLNVDRIARIQTTSTFEANAVVNIGTQSLLSLEGLTRFEGGTYQGLGELQQSGNAVVGEDTTIGTRHYDMDGANDQSLVTVSSGVTFTVNAQGLEATGDRNFDGTVRLNGGSLVMRTHDMVGSTRVEQPWNMRGTLELREDRSGDVATLGGNRMIVNQTNPSLPFAKVSVADTEAQLQAAVEFQTRSELELQFAGSSLGQFGRLENTKQVVLDGRLNLKSKNGFTPSVGASFDIVQGAALISGRFDSIVSDMGKWNILYAPAIVRVFFAGNFAAGDLNNDGSVDALDAEIMFGNWGGSGTGDLNGDGTVDAADAGTLFGDWTGDAHPAAVPEPTGGLLWLAALGLACRHRKASTGASV